MSTSRHNSWNRRARSSSRGRSPVTRSATQELDTWSERLQEEITTLIEDRRFSVRDAKEVKVLVEVLEAETLRDRCNSSLSVSKKLHLLAERLSPFIVVEQQITISDSDPEKENSPLKNP